MRNDIFSKKIILDEDACENILNCNSISTKDLKLADSKVLNSDEYVKFLNKLKTLKINPENTVSTKEALKEINETDWLTHGISKRRLWLSKKLTILKTKILLKLIKRTK